MRVVLTVRQALQDPREAQQARSVDWRPLSLTVPVTIRILRLAGHGSEVVEARGVVLKYRVLITH